MIEYVSKISTVIKTTAINISVICNSVINQGIPQKNWTENCCTVKCFQPFSVLKLAENTI